MSAAGGALDVGGYADGKRIISDNPGLLDGRGTSTAQCAACGLVVSGPAAFDRHQTVSRRTGVETCHQPGERGLVLDFVRDIWRFPSTGVHPHRWLRPVA